MNFRFIHAADLHLDTPFKGIGQVSPALGERLQNASLKALDHLVDQALEHDVHFVLLAGDLYDGADRGLRAQLRVHQALKTLSDAAIPTFIVYGNHDPVLTGWSAISAWPEHVHIFPHDHVGTVELQLPEGLVTVSGISYPTRHVTENLAIRFPRPSKPGFHVALLHATVGNTTDHAPYSPCSLQNLADSGYDYWALGHIHARQTLRAANPVVAYPGNTQGRSFKPSEQGPKGASLVTVDGHRVTTEFIDLGPIRFIEVEVPAADLEDFADLIDALIDAADEHQTRDQQTGDRDVLIRARVTGATSLYDELTRHEASDELLKLLKDRTGNDQGIWWASLRIDVRPARDLDALAEKDELPGEVVRQGRALAGDLEVLRRRLRNQRGLESWADRLTETELKALLDRATDLAASMVDNTRGE